MIDIAMARNGTEQSRAECLSGIRLVAYIFSPLIMALMVIIFVNFVVFHVFNYYFYVKPDSTMGTVEQAQDLVIHQIVPGKRNILVLGDSRISEGFSAALANKISGSDDINFIQAGMPGTEPRVWYYFLRKIDPEQNRFSAIVLMIPNYQENQQDYDPAARTDDLIYLQPLAGYRDAITIAMSYPGFQNKIHAFFAMVLRLSTARLDLLDFLTHPLERIKEAVLWHKHFYEWQLGYAGSPEQLPVLSRDQLVTLDVKKMELAQNKLPAMLAYIRHALGQPALVSAADISKYRMRWYGSIAMKYQRNHVPVIIFQVPRGPYESFLPITNTGSGAIGTLASRGELILLPTKPFEAIEQPQYFSDSLHVNTEGRKLLTDALSSLVVKQLTAH